MNPTPSRRALALTLAVTTLLFLVPAPVRAADDGELSGRVFQTDGVTPQAGVVVHLYDEGTEQIYSSDPTTDEGTFLIGQAPAGTYSLVAETGEVAFLAADELELQAGDNEPLALTLKTAPAQTGQQQQSNMKPWAKWVIAGAIIVTGLFLIYEVTKDDDEEQDVSPSVY
jgi:hypothetical protein